MMKKLICGAAVVLMSCQGASQSELASKDQAGSVAESPSVAPIGLGDSFRNAAVCTSDLSTMKIYVGENFMQEPSIVLLTLQLNNPALGVDALTTLKGELEINADTQRFEYVLTAEGEEVARLNLASEGGVPTRLVGPISIEGFDAECE